MANAWDDLFDRLEAADVAAMSYEEREAVADAIHSGSLEDAALSPRARILAEELAALVAKPDLGTTGVAAVVDTLTEPAHGKRPDEMTNDELEREIERRRKYR